MSTANTIKRLSALATALSVVTLEDLAGFSDTSVTDIIHLRRSTINEVEGLKYEERRKAALLEEEKNRKEDEKARQRIAETKNVPFGLTQEEWHYAKNKQVILAIKSIRTRTSTGLADAKRHLEQVLFNVGPGLGGCNHGVNVHTLAPQDPDLDKLTTPTGLTEQEWDYLKGGRKINVIKLLRERTGCGLREAKEHVEQVAYNVGIRDTYNIDRGIDVSILAPKSEPSEGVSVEGISVNKYGPPHTNGFITYT